MLGHQRIISALRTAIQKDNVSHAYIFEGPDGVGKRATALKFASMLMCREDQFPCGECKSCQLYREASNPDFQEIIQKDKSISVEEIRNILKGLVIRPLYSDYKVIIINDADTMTIQAQNALLKSLEEPPPYVVFILTVQSLAAVAQTIRSRCQRILFNRLSHEDIMEIMESKYGPRQSDWEFIVSYADGVAGTALELAESPHSLELREEVLEFTSRLVSDRDADPFKFYETFEKNNDRVDYILHVILLYFRDLLIYKETGDTSLLINSDKKDMIIRNVELSFSHIIKCIQAVWDARRGLGNNANFQLAIEVMLMKIQKADNA
ncbi:DNA polymerase III subunit delta' [Ruminiclostridium cellulolyticum]|uniref:DNA polymerase III subunit delta' n=1 Tax=Ruminiclostridium cellulolyticum (strain ATCC 35319 / DSM 5812 / JCM 6584 / H10) TaxID=394503 RepID=B8I4J3_RUMCH|nr:DNA polymerase III subunit delta' [Ruminiclostridium cellulolyticum]ACL74547.1 DNA polymerase III, delta prime subunit [Ruminiclostridium cellulolyticum H10]